MMKQTRSLYFCNYSIGEHVYDEVGKVCRTYGKKALLIGGEKALRAGKDRLLHSLQEDGLEIADIVIYGKDCTCENIRKWSEYARDLGVDMIFGMGGGRALDTAKGAAYEAHLPVFTFPTIASTCAATTALSVVYKEDGSFDSFYYFDRPARHAFIDMTIIAKAPWQYLQAGMGDTIGKYFECHFSARNDRLDHSSLLGREISNLCYEPLLRYGVQALKDCKNHVVTEALDQAVLANIVSTGLVSLTVLDCYNGAVAHSVYYGLCMIPGFETQYLHGNVVAYGVLVQLLIDGNRNEAQRLKNFLEQVEIPTTLREMSVKTDKEYLKDVLKDIVVEPDMEHIPYPITEDMLYQAMEQVEKL